jgi:hypothetical protein
MSDSGYSHLMRKSGAYISITLDLSEPVEVTDFARLFAGVGRQFDEYVESAHPSIAGHARIYIKEMRKGSIIADLMAQVQDMIDFMDAVLIVTGFGSLIGWRLKKYISGEKVEGVDKADIADIADMVKAVANDADGKAVIESVEYKNGWWEKSLIIGFDTTQARVALETLESHKRDLDKKEGVDHPRVLMVFERSSIKDAKVHVGSGERVIIESLDKRAKPLIYASAMAERAIKSFTRTTDENIYKKGFVVDVNVELRQGRVVGYRVTHLHDVIDLPEDDDPDTLRIP